MPRYNEGEFGEENFRMEYIWDDVLGALSDLKEDLWDIDSSLLEFMEDYNGPFKYVLYNIFGYVRVANFLADAWRVFYVGDIEMPLLTYAMAVKETIRKRVNEWKEGLRAYRGLHLAGLTYRDLEIFGNAMAYLHFSDEVLGDKKLRNSLTSLQRLLLQGWDWIPHKNQGKILTFEDKIPIPPNSEIWHYILLVLIHGDRGAHKQLIGYIEEMVNNPVFKEEDEERAKEKWFVVYKAFYSIVSCMGSLSFGGECSMEEAYKRWEKARKIGAVISKKARRGEEDEDENKEDEEF
jgi:hypothetical protein